MSFKAIGTHSQGPQGTPDINPSFRSSILKAKALVCEKAFSIVTHHYTVEGKRCFYARNHPSEHNQC